jgi:hypothetical protein
MSSEVDSSVRNLNAGDYYYTMHELQGIEVALPEI